VRTSALSRRIFVVWPSVRAVALTRHVACLAADKTELAPETTSAAEHHAFCRPRPCHRPWHR
jgi:hypothetical protein